MAFPLATILEAVGGLGGGVGAAMAVGSAMRTARTEREANESTNRRVAADKAKEDVRWKQHVSESLDGRRPTRDRPGFMGVVDRVSNLEQDRWGETRASIEPTGQDK